MSPCPAGKQAKSHTHRHVCKRAKFGTHTHVCERAELYTHTHVCKRAKSYTNTRNIPPTIPRQHTSTGTGTHTREQELSLASHHAFNKAPQTYPSHNSQQLSASQDSHTQEQEPMPPTITSTRPLKTTPATTVSNCQQASRQTQGAATGHLCCRLWDSHRAAGLHDRDHA
jgi:hypothetical protein